MNSEQVKATEYYGSVKGMPGEILRQRLQKATEDAAELVKEKTRREAFTSTEQLSDRLHHLLHFGTDCDYYYSDWPEERGCRAEFKQLAHQAEHWFATVANPLRIEDFPLGQLVTLLERSRFGQYFV